MKIVKANVVKSPVPWYHKAIYARFNCPLLIDSKCRIYDLRPVPCRKFPFETQPDEKTGFVLTLMLCPMSVNIIRDYAKWHEPINLGMSQKLAELYEQYKNIDTNDTEARIQMNENNLDSFITYLKSE